MNDQRDGQSRNPAFTEHAVKTTETGVRPYTRMMRPDPNVLLRVEPCAECGRMMLWTQNAWKHGDHRAAAYKCENGHVVDPALTRQCPRCGIHDTSETEPGSWECHRCGNTFTLGA
jgi:hypothetical protein